MNACFDFYFPRLIINEISTFQGYLNNISNLYFSYLLYFYLSWDNVTQSSNICLNLHDSLIEKIITPTIFDNCLCHLTK